mgnify:CR=1 FL=1
MERIANKYDLLNQAYADENLKRTTKAVMQYLVALSGSKGCHPAVATIARAIRMSERTVQRHIRILEQAGYIIRKSRYYHQSQLTNDYVFPFDVIDALEHNTFKTGSTADTTLNKRRYMDQVYQASLSAGEQVVLIYLVHKANRQGRVIKLKADIMQACHMSWRLVCRYLASLQNKGILIGYCRRNYVCCRLQEQDKWKMEKQVADAVLGAEDIQGAAKVEQRQNPEQVYPEFPKVYHGKTYSGSGYAFPDDPNVKIPIYKGKRKSVKQLIMAAGRHIRNHLHRWLEHFLS